MIKKLFLDLLFPYKFNVGKNLVVDPYYSYFRTYGNLECAEFFDNLTNAWSFALDDKANLWIYFSSHVDHDSFVKFFENVYPATKKNQIGKGLKIIV